jgi:putative transposase
MLEYEAAWRGVMLVAVPPTYTSQQCPACGFTDAGNRTSQARFSCLACGHGENADRNAAKNILRRAQEQLGASAGLDARPHARPARAAGYAGTHACAAGAARRRRPRRAARDGSSVSSAEPSLAGTLSQLSHCGNLHP